MKQFILLLNVLFLSFNFAQQDSIKFQAHQNLLDGIWKTEAKWSDGTSHKLHVSYELALNGTILKTKTYGNIAKEGFEFGLRNEGVRYHNPESNSIEFYEFDCFGGLIKGEVLYQDKDIYYSYKYGTGENAMTVTDGWEFLDRNTYKYTIGVYDFNQKQWKTKFLSAEMKRFTE